jgi:hypothetical protein
MSEEPVQPSRSFTPSDRPELTFVPAPSGPVPRLRAIWLCSPASSPEHCQWTDQATRMLRAMNVSVVPATSIASCAALAQASEVVFIEYREEVDAGLGSQESQWMRAWRAARAANKSVMGVLVAPTLSHGALRTALTERMIDVITIDDSAALRLVVQRASKRAAQRRCEQRNITKLRKRCEQLEASRRELLRQIGGLCDGVASAYQTAADGMKLNSLTAELNVILRQELDIESLLRVTLEYALKRLGPTNGAIFLPNSCGDYTLGAYVNYDMSKDTAETLIGTLADSLAPSLEDRRDVETYKRAYDLNLHSIDERHWLSDSTIAVRACWQDGECIATIAFFRDPRHPFTQEHLSAFDVLGDQFGKQLARVVKTHHRHRPGGSLGLGGLTGDAA